jgi:DNA/RNA endonuclease YhcR with UshA esterase domain
MRIVTLLVLLIFLLVFFSCGKRQEEVKINKFLCDDKTVVDSKVKIDTVLKEKESLTSAGESSSVITTGEAKNHINGNVIIKGYVADVVKREKVAYLNFDKKYPKNTFSAVIFDDKFSEVGDLNIYKNKEVEIKGVIMVYKDKPQIIVTSKNQIKLIK